ncbi:methyltransferase domain-containing protein [Saccharibacillus sp. CPCC 101409]|uniref:class I SAM-dependent methyltransferase n=1 Tax=Saccharibacillus sp. CPCC 101409 TaxID=3058041 RepID=UPI0026737304|nr:methyltransferase domain-containing protein [Saccharibacillus sp. CPCC 101409]MDO3408795.1 methyltransferase domain-containing protein [Saccharibacillus sp. CPCC 101409]
MSVRTEQTSGIRSLIANGEETGNNEKYRRMYDRIAPFYNLSNKAYFRLKFGGEAAYRMQFLSELEIPDGGRVLEVSCGTGDNFPYLPRNIDLHGLDLSLGMLKVCRRHLRKWKRSASLYHASAECLPFEDEMFDTVFHVGGINFFNDGAKAVQEMIRVAKSDTKIVIVDETEKLASGTYEKIPFVGSRFKDRGSEVRIPVHLVPEGMENIEAKEICGGLMYVLSFRVPKNEGGAGTETKTVYK